MPKTHETRIMRAARSLPAPEKDFSVTVIVRNNKLRERREKLGLTQKELAKSVGIPVHYYTGLESLRLPAQRPVRFTCRAPNCNNTIGTKEQLCVDCLMAYGTDPAGWALDQWPEKVYWVRPALKLAKFFECLVEDLFPPATGAIKKRRVTVAVNAADMEEAIEVIQLAALPKSERLALPSPEQEAIDADVRHQVEKVLTTLTPNEERVLRARFGFDGDEKTLIEIGKNQDLGSERIRQIEARALRRLRHPVRAGRLKSFHSASSHECPVCQKRAGYRCSSGTWFCGDHVRPADTCACRACVYRREQAKEQETREARRVAFLAIVVPADEPQLGEVVVSCPHRNNAGFKFYAFRAGPQTIGADTVAKICVCGYCIRAPANPFDNLSVVAW